MLPLRFSSLFEASQDGGVPGVDVLPCRPCRGSISCPFSSLDLTMPVLAIVAYLTLLDESILVMTGYSSSCPHATLLRHEVLSGVRRHTAPRGLLDTLAWASLAHTLALGERPCTSHRSDGAWPEVCFSFSGILSSGRHGSSPKNGF